MAKIENTTEVVKPVESSNDTLAQILDRLNKLEKENAELKSGKVNAFDKAKEKYKWPLKAKYWLRGDKPILSYKSYKGKEEYDLLYKTPSGEWVDNHFVSLTLADGEVVKKVLANSFAVSRVLSEESEFDVITDTWDRITKARGIDLQRVQVSKYVFKVWDEEIQVDFNCVN